MNEYYQSNNYVSSLPRFHWGDSTIPCPVQLDQIQPASCQLSSTFSGKQLASLTGNH